MIWQFQKQPWKVYPRNPLDTVVVQLKYQPILKISTGQGIPEFQELVRDHFPGFEEGEVRSIKVSADTQVSTNSEKVFTFIREEDTCKIQLSANNFIIESKDHQTREILLRDLKTIVGALIDVYSPIKPVRFGVRYINKVDTNVLSLELGRDVSLQSAISSEYLTIPASVADFDNTTFLNQISSLMSDGAMTLRYGLFRNDEEGLTTFNFDIDRFIEGETDLDTIDQLLTEFTGDIFSLFSTLPAADLLEWMSNSELIADEVSTN